MSTKTRTLYPTNGKTRPDADRVEKPKQTKSRTGCVTCKAKRLKCDEAKPTCLKCKKRDVVCEGYKKDWKWRPCETEAFTVKSEGTKQKKGTVTFKLEEATAHPTTPGQESFDSPSISSSALTPNDPSLKAWSPKATRSPNWNVQPPDKRRQDPRSNPLQQAAGFDISPPLSLSPPQSQDEQYSHGLGYQPPSSYNLHTSQQEQPYRPPHGTPWTLPQYSASSASTNLPPLSHVGMPPTFNANGYSHSVPSLSRQATAATNFLAPQQYGQHQDGYRQYNPARINQLLHPFNLPEPPASPSPSQASQSSNRSSSQTPTIDFMLNKDPAPHFRPSNYTPPLATEIFSANDHPEVMQESFEMAEPIEEIIRNPHDSALLFRSFPLNSSSSDSSSTPSEPDMQVFDTRQSQDSRSAVRRGTRNRIFQWKYSPSHEEMLVRTFMDNTCGILSVKNGETENPWKTHIWPLSHESPALRHAIISMAAFHGSEDNRDLILAGVSHSNRSFKGLRHDLQSGDVTKVITSLATSLALAFSESWNERGETAGVTHLIAAKHLVKRAKEVTRQIDVEPQLMSALSFLLNTYVYIAVIARLISIDDENTDFDANPLPASSPFVSEEIDPLMGCAGTLYPIIGKVTKLVGQVRKCERNSNAILEDARYLKSLVERWEPPRSFQPVEDPTLEEQHSILTAEAYRATTLLYLHQAVPEIESEPAAELASRALSCLAAVPITSGAVIIQIFPLLAAGCEASSQEVRDWVENRWDEMKRRMKIRNLDRCLDVTREVWRRRDVPVETDPPDVVCGVGPQLYSVSLPQTEYYIPGQEAMSFGFPIRVFDYPGGTPNFPGQLRPEDQVHQAFDKRKTVRGWAHWVRVMRSWNWEILLG